MSRNKPTNPEVILTLSSSTSPRGWSNPGTTSPVGRVSSSGGRFRRQPFLSPRGWCTRTGVSRSFSRRRSAIRMRRWSQGSWGRSARWSRTSRPSTPSASTFATRASEGATMSRASARTSSRSAKAQCSAPLSNNSTPADWLAASWKWTSRCP